MLVQAGFLFGFYLLGSLLRELFHIPLPGSIIGLLLLWGLLSVKVVRLEWVENGAYLFLSVLPLYLLPATVGVMDYLHIFTGKGLLLVVITIVSTFITMATASVFSERAAVQRSNKEVEAS